MATSPGGARPLRLAVLGAFPFPSPQGSQVFAAAQARALLAAGAEPCLVTYGRGEGPPPEGIPWAHPPAGLAPPKLRSGPHWAKPFADAALLGSFLAAHRRHRFDAVLAHNVEAAWVGIGARSLVRLPVIYFAHTLMGEELPCYAGPHRRERLRALGRRIDEATARQVDAVAALTERTASALAYPAGPEVVCIPPGLDEAAPPDPGAQARACRRAGVTPGRFALYAGNLDGYQGIDLLALAAGPLRERGIETIAVTHDAGGARSLGSEGALRVVESRDFAEVRALQFAAGALVLPRRIAGGFPIKLLNYLETGRPIVAFGSAAGGLVPGHSAVLLADGAGSSALVEAVVSLLAGDERSRKIGSAGRHTLEEHFRWPPIAEATLKLTRRVLDSALVPGRLARR